MRRYIIDRLEGEHAVCEDEERQMHTFPLTALPDGAREGDGICLGDDGRVRPDPEYARQNRLAAQALLKKLLKQEERG